MAASHQVTLPPDVVSGFEALAAVLPVGSKKPEPAQESSPSPSVQQEATDVPTPRVTSPEQSVSPDDTEPIQDDLEGIAEPLVIEDSNETAELPSVELSFDDLDTFDYSEATWTIDDLEIEEIQRPPERSESTGLASPRSNRSLLLDFYRIPSPSPVYDMDSLLVQHYFKNVCVLFSSFDSVLNPFRTTIGRIFQESSSVYYAIQVRDSGVQVPAKEVEVPLRGHFARLC
jgi:hypothetical protein